MYYRNCHRFFLLRCSANDHDILRLINYKYQNVQLAHLKMVLCMIILKPIQNSHTSYLYLQL